MLAKNKKLRKLRRQMIKFFGCDITSDIILEDSRGTYTTNTNGISALSIDDIQKAINIIKIQAEEQQRWTLPFYYKSFDNKLPFVILKNATA